MLQLVARCISEIGSSTVFSSVLLSITYLNLLRWSRRTCDDDINIQCVTFCELVIRFWLIATTIALKINLQQIHLNPI